jgi:hypothetical protein
MNILFIGDLNESARSCQRYRTLQRMGHAVTGITVFPISSAQGSELGTFIDRVSSKLGIPFDRAGTNRAVRRVIAGTVFDLVWIEKGNSIRPGTLRFVKRMLPNAPLISLSEDDMYASHNRSWYYTRGLRSYDCVFTTKTYNLAELPLLGARRVELFLDAYDETLHRPIELTEEQRARFGCDVGFVGTFEEPRFRSMLFLAEHGIPVTVWGNGWESVRGRNPNLLIKNEALSADEYVVAVNATKVNLCFLRKMNRDEVTSRSVEIPACGGFMLGERTARHLEFFREGEEAEFFSSNEELLKKIQRYRADDRCRAAIALAGRGRCTKSGYDHTAQLKGVLLRVMH